MLDHCGIAGDALLPCYLNMHHILYPAVAIYLWDVFVVFLAKCIIEPFFSAVD